MSESIAAQIKRNSLKVYLSSLILTIIIVLLGSMLSYFFGWGMTGTGWFLIVAGVINFIAYFFSDRLLLRISKAVPTSREQVPELYETVESLCRKANIPTPKIYLMNDNTMNAFATGRNYKHSAIAVTRGLLQKMTHDEVEAVLAHEISHIQNYDMRTMAVISILAGITSILADLYWSSSLLTKAQDNDPSGILTIVGTIISVFAPLTAFFIQLSISRKRELVADACSASLTGKPQSLAAALRKISLDIRLPKNVRVSTAHLYFSSPSSDSWIDKLFSTHPPIEERIKLLEEM